jgi:hypothetical protein
MLSVPCPFLLTLSSVFRSRTALQVEILALRHQIGVFRRSAKNRPKLTVVDRVFWAWLSGPRVAQVTIADFSPMWIAFGRTTVRPGRGLDFGILALAKLALAFLYGGHARTQQQVGRFLQSFDPSLKQDYEQ